MRARVGGKYGSFRMPCEESWTPWTTWEGVCPFALSVHRMARNVEKFFRKQRGIFRILSYTYVRGGNKLFSQKRREVLWDEESEREVKDHVVEKRYEEVLVRRYGSLSASPGFRAQKRVNR